MAYPGNAQVGSDVIGRDINKTDRAQVNKNGVITRHDESRKGSNNTSKAKAELVKSD